MLTGCVAKRTESFRARTLLPHEPQRLIDSNLWILQIFAGVNLVESVAVNSPIQTRILCKSKVEPGQVVVI